MSIECEYAHVPHIPHEGPQYIAPYYFAKTYKGRRDRHLRACEAHAFYAMDLNPRGVHFRRAKEGE